MATSLCMCTRYSTTLDMSPMCNADSMRLPVHLENPTKIPLFASKRSDVIPPNAVDARKV